MSIHDLPSDFGKADPGLRLPSDRLSPAHLEYEADGSEIAAHRQDLQPKALFLDARTGRSRQPVRMDHVEAVTVLVYSESHRVRAIPERGVEYINIFVEQGMHVALKQRSEELRVGKEWVSTCRTRWV